MVLREKEGIILWARNHAEKDKMVKLFTRENGKMMTYAKGVHRKKSPIAFAIQPFTKATYIGNFQTGKLSFLNEAKNVQIYPNIQADIQLSAHVVYVLNLVDAVIEDEIPDVELFQHLEDYLLLVENGQDVEVLTNIFEVQLLSRFGSVFDFGKCVFCGRTSGRFDLSTVNHGVLCEGDWGRDERRLHISPKVVNLLRMFEKIEYRRIGQVGVRKETKVELRRAIDLLYEEYVGIHLKSKKFLDDMEKWENKW